MIYLWGTFLIINMVGFMTMYVDKRRAKQQRWRVPEKRLWLLAFLGGAFGLMIGMRQFRHKTKHRSFTIGLPISFLLNMVMYICLSYIVTVLFKNL